MGKRYGHGQAFPIAGCKVNWVMDSATIRSSVLANAVASLSAIDGVDAIYLSGSLAEKVEDQYSDIDLRVVVTDGAYESIMDSESYFSRLAVPVKLLASRSEKDGHCSSGVAQRLLDAIDQMILLAATGRPQSSRA